MTTPVQMNTPWPGFADTNWLAPAFPDARLIGSLIRPRRGAASSPLHGWAHWRGVAAIGCRLAVETAHVDMGIVVLFALLHDVERRDDGDDPEHGERSATLVEKVGSSLGLTRQGIALLSDACRFHNQGYVTDDLTTGTCWDADRLTLPRVGMTPTDDYLSTELGRKAKFKALGEKVVWSPPSWVVAVAPFRDYQVTGV